MPTNDVLKGVISDRRNDRGINMTAYNGVLYRRRQQLHLTTMRQVIGVLVLGVLLVDVACSAPRRFDDTDDPSPEDLVIDALASRRAALFPNPADISPSSWRTLDDGPAFYGLKLQPASSDVDVSSNDDADVPFTYHFPPRDFKSTTSSKFPFYTPDDPRYYDPERFAAAGAAFEDDERPPDALASQSNGGDLEEVDWDRGQLEELPREGNWPGMQPMEPRIMEENIAPVVKSITEEKPANTQPSIDELPKPQHRSGPQWTTMVSSKHIANRPIHATRDPSSDIYFTAIVAGCSAAAVIGVVVAGIFWYKLQRRAKAAAEAEYPAYGVTGPRKDLSPPGDRKLAQSAQMYHYQHQKQQMIALESSRTEGERTGSASDGESEEENEEGDYTVYECPGLAPTGEMEVKNPLFNDEPTPATPAITVSTASTTNGGSTTSLSSSGRDAASSTSTVGKNSTVTTTKKPTSPNSKK